MRSEQLNSIVDSICHRGCKYVNAVLSDEQTRAQCPELEDLTESKRHRVLQELQSVMSVYHQSGNCEI